MSGIIIFLFFFGTFPLIIVGLYFYKLITSRIIIRRTISDSFLFAVDKVASQMSHKNLAIRNKCYDELVSLIQEANPCTLSNGSVRLFYFLMVRLENQLCRIRSKNSNFTLQRNFIIFPEILLGCVYAIEKGDSILIYQGLTNLVRYSLMYENYIPWKMKINSTDAVLNNKMEDSLKSLSTRTEDTSLLYQREYVIKELTELMENLKVPAEYSFPISYLIHRMANSRFDYPLPVLKESIAKTEDETIVKELTHNCAYFIKIAEYGTVLQLLERDINMIFSDQPQDDQKKYQEIVLV